MGREIRRVPRGWEHPVNEHCHHMAWGGHGPHESQDGKCFKPLHDHPYEPVAQEWLRDCAAWEDGTYEKLIEHPEYKKDCPHYWEYAGNPPSPEYYRPDWKPEEMTCYQIYETVSEGTPVSPVFESKAEMVEWLVEQGHTRPAAENFVKSEWVPSMVISDGVMRRGIDAAETFNQ